jgi:hypothetical protein
VVNYVYNADNQLSNERFSGTGQTPLRVDLAYYDNGDLETGLW